ncbi:MAG TPA: sialate O-acetylesterase [Planctomycetota bacterium]|nr:sialate O-acetylesterase [Planctomycetota bacterium]
MHRLPCSIALLWVFLAVSCRDGGRGDAAATGSALSALPPEWHAGDVGAVGHAGSAAYDAGTFTIAGSGADIWDAADGFHFVRQTLHGNGTLIARVLSLDPTDSWAKAGVMIRDTLEPSSRFAMVIVTPSNGTSLQYRTAAGGGCSLSWGPGLAAPAWVRLVRTGDTFQGAASADGVTWTSAGEVSIPMGATVHAGLCVTAHNNAALTTARFEAVSMAPAGAPPAPPGATLAAAAPLPSIVYQRDNANQAAVPLRGTYTGSVTRVEARAIARAPGQGTGRDWTVVDDAPSGGSFGGSMVLSGGWYTLELRALSLGQPVAAATVGPVGVGEVFVVVGHSVAQGQDIHIEGSSDERAVTIPDTRSAEERDRYNATADPRHLPPFRFSAYTSGVTPSPYGSGTYFWGKFSQYVVESRNVPVVLLNAAFGGTSLEHWAKSSQGIAFPHSFVNSGIRMPYINLYNSLKHYVNHTGVRAVLADQGQNDWPNPDANQVFEYYRTWVDQARADLGHAALAVVVNRQTAMGNRAIRDAQERMIREVPHCYPGPDYDTLAPSDTHDGVHLSAQGCWTAARKWADALGDGFFSASRPYVP